jgi:hypothetical protein
MDVAEASANCSEVFRLAQLALHRVVVSPAPISRAETGACPRWVGGRGPRGSLCRRGDDCAESSGDFNLLRWAEPPCGGGVPDVHRRSVGVFRSRALRASTTRSSRPQRLIPPKVFLNLLSLHARDRGACPCGGGVGISRGSGETVGRSTNIRRTGCSGVSALLKDGATIFGNQAATAPPFHRMAPSQ